MNEKNRILTASTAIPGWLTRSESEFLYDAASKVPAELAIVEIGSWKGRSTTCIAGGSVAGNKAKVYAVDHHVGSIEHQGEKKVDTLAEFLNNIKAAGVADVVTPIVKKSVDAAKSWEGGRVGMIFIDGSHEYEDVVDDFDYWMPHLSDNALIVFHDSSGTMYPEMPGYDGPRKAVFEKLIMNSRISGFNFVDTVSYGRRCEKRGFEDTLKTIAAAARKIMPDLLSYYSMNCAKFSPLKKKLIEQILKPYTSALRKKIMKKLYEPMKPSGIWNEASFDPESLRMQSALVMEGTNKTGDLKGLAYFYAALRDMEKFDALKQLVSRGNTPDMLYCSLLDHDRTGIVEAETIRKALECKDVFVYYTLVKIFLKKNMPKEALEFLKAASKKDLSAYMVFGFLASWCAAKGEKETGLDAINTVLEFNPNQEDLLKIKALLMAGRKLTREFYLDSMPKQEDISFYIPMYNVEKYVKTAIEGILALTYPVFEIIAVNDGTPDNSVAIAKTYPVRIIEHPKNLGLAAARNTAFKNAKGSLVGAFDTDAYPSPDYMQRAMMELENRDTNFAGFGGCLIELNQKKPADKWRAVHLAQHFGIKRVFNPDFIFGSNVIFDKQAVASINGFNEMYRTNYEDVDTCRRLKAAGFKLIYMPAAQAYHARVDDTVSVLKTRWNWFFWNYHEKGYYKDLKMLKGAFMENIRWLGIFANMDLTENRRSILFLDFLDFYFSLSMDLNYAVKTGICTDAAASRIYLRCLRPVSELDAKFGGDFFGKIHNTLEEQLRFRLDTQAPETDDLSHLNDYFASVDESIGSIDRVLYHLLSNDSQSANIKFPVSIKDTDKMTISVIIPTFNRFDSLKLVLDGLYKNGLTMDDEIIISDDGSSADIAEIVKDFTSRYKNIKVLKGKWNKGPAAARNAAMRVAEKDIVLFIGDDMIPGKDLIKKHKQYHKKYPHDNYAMIGHVDWYPGIKVTPFMRSITEVSGEQFKFYTLTDEQETSDYHYFYTCNVSLKRVFMDQVGIFDEMFPFAIVEDTEFGRRLMSQGMKLIYAKHAVVLHNHELNLEGFMKRQFVGGKSLYYFLVKNFEAEAFFENAEYAKVLGGADRRINVALEQIKKLEASGAGLDELAKFYALVLHTCVYKGVEAAALENSGSVKLEYDGKKWEVLVKNASGALVPVSSRRNPEAEAKAIASKYRGKSKVLFIGAGLSLHIKAFLEDPANSDSVCYVFEPHEFIHNLLRKKADPEKYMLLKRHEEAFGLLQEFDESEVCILPALKNSESVYAQLYSEFCRMNHKDECSIKPAGMPQVEKEVRL